MVNLTSHTETQPAFMPKTHLQEQPVPLGPRLGLPFHGPVDLNRTRRAEQDIVRQGKEGSLGHCLARHKKHDDERLVALVQPRLGLDGRAHGWSLYL